MGFISKIKNILFEEEEVIEEPVKSVEKKIEEPKEEVVKREIPEERVYEQPKESKPIESVEDLSDRELFKSESTFKFPAFDEEEFEKTMPKTRTTNVLAYEKKKERPKRVEYSRYERTEVVEPKKKFKPSPIISPVYGVLDKDYKSEDIMPKKKENDIVRPKVLDVDSVRRKAFGTLEDDIEKIIAEPEVTYYEESIEIKKAKEEVELKKELEEKIRTIDELLEDSATDEMIIDSSAFDEEEEIIDIDSELDKLEEEDSLSILDGIDDVEANIEDTLESDLFDLIDSMYENKEEE